MSSYSTVKKNGEFRFEDRHSEFLGFAKPVSQEAEAQDFIASVKKRYPDARHWVYAYVLRENSLMRYTDDREPQGTAGMPVLDSIRKRGLSDIVVVVVRYFGGILLGTGGLVHAYTEAAAGAISDAVPITYNLYTELRLGVSYSDYQKIIPFFEEFSFIATNTDYTDSVCVFGNLPSELADRFSVKLTESTGARCEIERISEKFDYRE